MSLFRKNTLTPSNESLPTDAQGVLRCLSDNETPLYACPRASFTLEAAVIIPLTTAFFVFLLFFFRVLQIQTAVQSALSYAGRKAAASASLEMGELADFVVVETVFRTEIQGNELISRYVSGGVHGISLLKSDISGEKIELYADYKIKFPISFFYIKDIYIEQSINCRKWIGRAGGDTRDLEDYVYITESGSVYHKSRECGYVRPSIKTTLSLKINDLRNENGEKYQKCERCADKNSSSNIFYITEYGNRYHTDIACSGLKRTVIRIPASEKGNRRGCKKCVGEESA